MSAAGCGWGKSGGGATVGGGSLAARGLTA